MFTIRPIGFAYNNRVELEDGDWGNVVTTIQLIDALPEESLWGIDAFSHLEIIYYFNKVDERKIVTGARHPRNNPRFPRIGIFAQRGKNRPNRLGLTTVKLLERDGKILTVLGLDCIDGTPILDIKPVMEEFLPREPISQPDWSKEIMKNYWEKYSIKTI